MNKATQPPTEAASTKAKRPDVSHFPRAILSVSQEEFDRLELRVKQGLTEQEGKLPSDLQGHFFMVAPAGTVNSKHIDNTSVTLPSYNGWTPLFNGDGMIYRLDFEAGQARLTTRILKTPCYYADRATYENEKFKNLRFENIGFGRLSLDDKGLKLGVRNQINTAFLPFKFSTDEQERLLVTWDMGRPYEVDPQTLELIAPVGWNQEWQQIIPLLGSLPPFPQVMTSAHLCFDSDQGGSIFTVNICKSLSTFLWLSRSLNPRLKKILASLEALPKNSPLKRFVQWFSLFIDWVQLSERVFNLFSKRNFVYLLRWDGKDVGNFDRWQVVLDNGSPVKIQQTLHQMGITKDYIVLADTSFKLDWQETLPYEYSQVIKDIEVFGIDALDYPQLPDTNIYIVRRADLKPSNKKVKARHVKIPLAMAHYLVEYENPDGKIILHATHLCATDTSETIRNTDSSVYDDPEITSDLQQLPGTVCGPMDVSRLGCHAINVENGEVESNYVSDINYTWATAFYVYRDEMPTKKFEDIYWNSWGCWSDILSKHILNLYEDYEYRIVPVEQVLKLARKGIPANLCRLHVERTKDGRCPKIELQDRYQFPEGYLGTSAQFVPREGSTGQTNGYIVCVVIHSDHWLSCNGDEGDKSKNWSDNSEIWIFDAQQLQEGPLYRLSHSQLNLGFTLHTTWLKAIPPLATPRPKRNYSVRKDYEWLIDQQPEDIRGEIRDLFEHYVYPNFDS